MGTDEILGETWNNAGGNPAMNEDPIQRGVEILLFDNEVSTQSPRLLIDFQFTSLCDAYYKLLIK